MKTDEAPKKDNPKGSPLSGRRTAKLVCACLAMFMLGFLYGWSVFSTPIAAEFQWEPTTLAFTFTLLMWLFCAGGFVGAKICERTNSHVAIIIAAVFILLAFVTTALLARADAPWILYLTYSVLGGLGVGMAYTVAMATILAWFPDRAGTASGILLQCYGASTMILSSVVAWLFTIMNWRVAFPVIAIAMTTILVVCGGILLRRPTDEELALLPKPKTIDGEASDAQRSYTTAEMLRAPMFWSYVVWMVICCTIALGFTGNANQFALSAGAQPAFAVAMVGIYSVCNGLGRLMFGFVYDAIGVAKTILIVAIAHGAAAVLIAAGLLVQSVPLMVFALVFAGLAIGGTPVCGAGYTATAFGPDHYAQNFSILNLAIIPGALIGPIVLSVSLSATGGFVPGLLGGAVLSLVAIAFALITGKLIKNRS